MSLLHVQDPDVVITNPNRDSAASKATRIAVIVVLVASAVLLAVITVGSDGARAGALVLQILLGLLFAYFAYLVSQWRSGALPIAAGFAIAAGIFAAVSVPSWFERGGTGYESPPLDESVIGVLVLAFAILQLVSVVLCMRGVSQNWQVEVEVPKDQYRGGAIARGSSAPTA